MIPSLLNSRLQIILGDNYNAVIESFAKNRKGSFRINLIKSSQEDVLKEFSEKGIIVELFGQMNNVFVFDRQYEFAIKGTDAFYNGKIYLQSIASMLPVLALSPKSHSTIIDVCAAPGSKTTQLAMMMQNQGKIYAIEQNQIRFDKLMYNCKLQGTHIVEGIKMDARKWLSQNSHTLVDSILLDAPCSAEGRISIDNPKTYGFWSLNNIIQKSELQLELLNSAFHLLKNGGEMLYSTCTLAPEENEGVMQQFLDKNKNASLEIIDIGLGGMSWWSSGLSHFEGLEFNSEIQKTVRILPSEYTEGFYMAKIRKI